MVLIPGRLELDRISRVKAKHRAVLHYSINHDLVFLTTFLTKGPKIENR